MESSEPCLICSDCLFLLLFHFLSCSSTMSSKPSGLNLCNRSAENCPQLVNGCLWLAVMYKSSVCPLKQAAAIWIWRCSFIWSFMLQSNSMWCSHILASFVCLLYVCGIARIISVLRGSVLPALSRWVQFCGRLRVLPHSLTTCMWGPHFNLLTLLQITPQPSNIF